MQNVLINEYDSKILENCRARFILCSASGIHSVDIAGSIKTTCTTLQPKRRQSDSNLDQCKSLLSKSHATM